ncbi:hypothetical protein HFO55_01630 [Rhizobium leguminosarum]|uniref:Abi-alpha family protein n=1 Tax=Rhizobium leguminosarum TaxID=384 RepID=UPI001C9764F9|nr:hypothetical protein [Rhizobium leguminosarum]MBY5565961.1 hypothetical protein [Rhizobium leguminosarum]MBY5573059.1 hypothetical protein [Rhizobium leguminosarum]
MTGDNKSSSLPVNIDVSAKAELKAEVPEKSVGRTLDALTDLIRPFTESLGLRADRIRLQREDVLIEIARKARARMAIEETVIRPIPLRVMVPLLEKASLADPDDQVLIDAWSYLLQSASEHDNANHGLFIDVLSKLDPAHLRLLEFLMLRDKNGHPDDFLNINVHEAERFLSDTIYDLVRDKAYTEDEALVEALDVRLLEFFTVNGCLLLSGGVACSDDTLDGAYYELSSQLDLSVHPEALVDALAGVNIVERTMIQFDNPRFHIWMVYISMTVFGFEMYGCCHPSRQLFPGDDVI